MRTTQPRTTFLRTTLLTTTLAVAPLLAACGDDDDAEAGSAGDTVDVTAVDFAFEGLPTEVEAGTTVTLHNDSDGEVHELVAWRLPDGEERSAEELLALPEQEIGALLAGPPDVGLLALPGESGHVMSGDGTFAEPGRYLVFCAIPMGAAAGDVEAAIAEAQQSDGPPPEIPGGPPHFTAGMFTEIQVD